MSSIPFFITIFILALAVPPCHASDDDFDDAHENVVEERLEDLDDDDAEDEDFEEIEDKLEERFEERFGYSEDLDDDLEDRFEEMLEDHDDHDDDFEDELEDEFEDRMEDRLERMEQRVPGSLDRLHQLSELDERLDDLEVLVIPDQYIELMSEEDLQVAREQGADIQAVEKLGGLGQLLVTFGEEERPQSAELNHVYTLDAPTALPTQSFPNGLTPVAAASHMGMTGQSSQALKIGMMDSSILESHTCFQSTPVTQRRFYPHGAAPDYGHGTAMASVFSSGCGVLTQASIFNAVVFGRAASGIVVASAADLIRGLDWLLSAEPDVINLSLSGPPNRMLSAAIQQLLSRGIRIVASVGNEGPAAFPRYPAAQPGVIAITAVDSELAIYKRAVQGEHLSFAAPGVGLRLADAGGTFLIKEGTSVAAALASAVLASGMPLKDYEAAAIDLGSPGFDPVFGFGLLNIDKITAASGE